MHHPRKSWFGVFAALLIAVSGAFAQPKDDGAIVRVGVAKMEKVRELRGVTGRLEPARRSLLSAEESGLVVDAPPEPGLAVKADEVVARVDDTLLKSERAAAQAVVEQMQAQLEERKAQLDLSRRNLARFEDLQKTKAAQLKEVEDARSTFAIDTARLNTAKAELDEALALRDKLQQRIVKTQVKAPFDGFIVRKNTELGQWLVPGDPVCEVVEIGRVKARLDVPEALVGRIDAAEPIALTFDALGKTREAPLFSIVPDGNPQSRTFALLVKLDNPDGSLKPGMSVSAQLPTGRTIEALTVPRDAVTTTPSGTVIFVNRGGIAVMLPADVRFGVGDRFVVQADLKDGEQVVTEGNERLRSGQPLKIQGDKPQAVK